MTTTDLRQISDELLERAAASPAQRAAHTIHGGSDHPLRQTVIALIAGSELDEHENPGDATLHVLRGRVELRSGGGSTAVGEGELAPIPPARHSLSAAEDSIVLLTVVKA